MASSEDLTCAEFVELASDYVEGALDASERSRFEQHLDACGGCSIHFQQLRATIELSGRLRPQDVPEDAAAVLLAAFRGWRAAGRGDAVTAAGAPRRTQHESHRSSSRDTGLASPRRQPGAADKRHPGVSEAQRKRSAALAAVGPFATDDLAAVRWLLCGRGRPVSAGTSPYIVEVREDAARVWYQDIERSRVEAEERWEELGYEPTPYPWHQAPPDFVMSHHLQPLRLELGPEEIARYRSAGRDAAAAMVEVLGEVRPEQRELDVAGALAGRLHAAGFTTPVVLVGGASRAAVHRHPLPTDAALGAFALLAFSAERDGLYTSLTRIVSFGAPPAELEHAVEAAAEVDASILDALRPGRTLGEIFDVLVRAYADVGYADEWRLHHQGGLTGYAGREVFAVPRDDTVLPVTCAVAFNPSITGGGKSEDTVVVGARGIEVLTQTPSLPRLANGRPAIVVV